MNRVHRVLLMLISMGVIMLAAVGMDKAYREYGSRKMEEERYSRYMDTRAQVKEIGVKIAELSEDEEAIQSFLEEKISLNDPADENETPEDLSADSLSGNVLPDGGLWGDDLSGNFLPDGGLSGNVLPDGGLSGNSLSGNSLSGNHLSDDYVAYTGITGDEGLEKDILQEAGLAKNQIKELLARLRSGKLTLKERRKLGGSYLETIRRNRLDKQTISQSTIDFSDVKIVCLGDSITAATNLEGDAEEEQDGYPARLQVLLGAAEVRNLGIGGSSIGRYWDQAFVDRYREIPGDADIILVMGGTNDGFCATAEDIGSLEERKRNTFAGDLDELMRGLKENYPEAMIIFATPLSNVLQEILRKERSYLLPQENLITIINQLSEEYQIPVIDFYNSNFLDSYDSANIYNFLPDGVHCNPAGYQVLAEHFAAEIIRIFNQQEKEP